MCMLSFMNCISANAALWIWVCSACLSVSVLSLVMQCSWLLLIELMLIAIVTLQVSFITDSLAASVADHCLFRALHLQHHVFTDVATFLSANKSYFLSTYSWFYVCSFAAMMTFLFMSVHISRFQCRWLVSVTVVYQTV